MNKDTSAPVDVLAGPPARVHDGWDGLSRPMYRLDHPCGCRASEANVLHSVCCAHLLIANQRDRSAALARAQGSQA